VTADDLDEIRSFDADIGCIAFGNPKQEQFIARFGAHLGIPVLIGVGGTLDFIVGEQRRAPRWMQRSGLEWLHRAGSDPRRLARRYARDARVFLPALARQAWRGRPRRTAGGLEIRVGETTTVVDVSAISGWTNADAHRMTTVLRRAAFEGRTVTVVGFDTCSPSWPKGVSDLISGHLD
jgi:N-acetylglucosaminyldiphosphoundecaprenol N-acetyl-beta-D-mannosaminyltransferase